MTRSEWVVLAAIAFLVLSFFVMITAVLS